MSWRHVLMSSVLSATFCSLLVLATVLPALVHTTAAWPPGPDL